MQTTKILTAGVIAASLLACHSNPGLNAQDAVVPAAQTTTTTAEVVAVAAPSSSASTFKVVSWNLEHFVDPYDDPYVTNEKEDGPEVKSAEVLDRMAVAFRTMNADVIALQEVESDRAVKLFIDTYIPDMGYKYYACVPSMEWYQNVVVVSRFPIGTFTSFREVEITNPINNESRSNINNRLLAVEISPTPDDTFLLMNLHLKAGPEEADKGWRLAQIDLINKYLAKQTALRPDLPIVVTGDFNLVPTSDEYKALTTSGAVNLWGPFEEWGYPPSHPSRGPSRLIDHIVVNESMKTRYVDDSVSVALPLSLRDMASITDHLPVVATFTRNP